jgi:hypothetical protein
MSLAPAISPKSPVSQSFISLPWLKNQALITDFSRITEVGSEPFSRLAYAYTEAAGTYTIPGQWPPEYMEGPSRRSDEDNGADVCTFVGGVEQDQERLFGWTIASCRRCCYDLSAKNAAFVVALFAGCDTF